MVNAHHAPTATAVPVPDFCHCLARRHVFGLLLPAPSRHRGPRPAQAPASLGRHVCSLLPYMADAVILQLGTSLGMLLPVGFGQAPGGWHTMLAIGIVMAAVFAYVYWVLSPKLRTDC